MALRTVGVKLTADVSQFTSALGRAGAATKDFSGKLDKAAQGGHLDKVADAAGIAGIGLAGLAVGALKMSADFDKAMSGVHAAILGSGGTVRDLGALRAAALQAGKDTQYSATQAAGAITELSKAGVSTADVLNGGLKGALALAAAGQLDVGEAAETAASAMVQFKLSGKDIPHIADLLAAGAGKAQGSVHDMGAALKQSGLVASQFGLSVEDTTGVLAEFANAGLTGSDAGTSFKTMLLAIANPSKQTRDLMNELGISFYDARGQFIGISGVAEVLRQRFHGLTDAQRQQALGQLFGNDAIRAASVLYADGAAGVQKWRSAVDDAGYASKTAQIQTDNLAGDLERLRGSIETLAIQAGSGANGGLRTLVKAADSLVGAFSALPPVIGSTITVVAGMSGVALVLGAGWLKLRKTTAELRAEIATLGPTAERASAGMGRLVGVAGKASVVFAALQIAGEAIGHFQKDLNPQIDALAVGLQKYAQTGKTAGETSRVLGDDLGDLKKTFDLVADTGAKSTWARNIQGGLESIVPGLKGANDSLTQTKERISSVDAALAQMVSSGNASGANAAFQALAAQLATGKVSMEEFRKQFPQYAAAVETAGGATKSTTGKVGDLNSALAVGAAGQDKYKTSADAVAGAARGEREALGALFSTLKAETDPVFALIDAQKKLRDAQKAYTAAVKAHGRNSAEARAADIDLAQAALGLQNSVGNLTSTFTGKLDPAFVATLKAAGLTKAQIAQVEQQFKTAKTAADKFAGNYAAKASAPGAKDAKKQLDDAYTAANHFAGPYRASVSVTGDAEAMIRLRALNIEQNALRKGVSISTSAARALAGDAKAAKDRGVFAEGGWTGPGSKWQPAGVVHRDEFVVNKSARGSLEDANPGGLDYMNQTGRWPGYASGGRVWPFPATAAMTRIPSKAEALNAVIPAMPGGGSGPGYKWMERIVRAAFPGIGIYSDFRPGAITVTGNRSYHAVGRAVDFAPSRGLAEWINANYFGATRELITPWQSLNIKDGKRHTYSAIVEAGHDFAHGNAHDHWAMRHGGSITEPIFGVGASGRTYSFGENYQPERVIPNWQGGGGGGATTVNVNITAPIGAHPFEIAQQVAGALGTYLQGGGELRVNGQKVL